MSHNILITGGSGYLGGSLLAGLSSARLPSYNKLYALVRTDEQAEKVKDLYGAEPLSFDPSNSDAVRENIVKHQITVVFYLIDAMKSEPQMVFIKALEEVKMASGKDVHFLHTSGAKIFSSHSGSPTDRPLLDSDPDLHQIQKEQKAPIIPLMDIATQTNCKVIEQADASGVRSYIFAPCIVYGEGEGFGNLLSIQTVSIVKAALAAGQVYKPSEARLSWPVCHIHDNTALYLAILRSILGGENPGHGKSGYYLAASGSVAWDDLYSVMAQALHQRGRIETPEVTLADQSKLEIMLKGIGLPDLQVPAAAVVNWAIGGSCTFTADRGSRIGWAPKYGSEHILEDADREVEFILRHL